MISSNLRCLVLSHDNQFSAFTPDALGFYSVCPVKQGSDMTFGARDTSFPYSSDGTDGWTALLLNISLRTNWSLQKAWCNHQQHHQTGSSFLPWVNDIIFLFRNISPAGSHWFHCLPKCNQLFVQVPGCLSAPQVLPFLQEWPHPVPTPPRTHTPPTKGKSLNICSP